MRKPIQFILIGVIVILVGASAVLFTKYRKTSADYAGMKAQEETTRERYSQTIDAIAEIQDRLNAISLGDTSVQMRSRNEQQMTGTSGRDALDRIATLRASIARSKLRIRQLESSLNKTGIRIGGLEKMVARLKRDVTDKETMVAQLSTRVDTLQTQVAGLETEVQQNQDTLRIRDETLEAKRRELATVYVAVGSKRDLAHKGVIVAKGGVLGLGKTLQPSGLISDNAFTPLDTDQQTVLPIPAAKARVLSAQPPTSYELKLVEGKVELHIIDPTEFRKVRQLVILTA